MGMKRNQKGFGAVEGLLILIIVLLIGFIGYYVYHTSNSANSSYNNAANASATTSIAPKNDAKTVVGAKAKDTLTKLWNHPASDSIHSYVAAHISDGLFTSNFKSLVDSGKYDNTGGNPITCTNGIAPDHFDIGTVSLQGDTATVTLINAGSNGAHDWSYNPTPTMKYLDGNWAVDNFECANNPSAPH
jgi:hypothetical protein